MTLVASPVAPPTTESQSHPRGWVWLRALVLLGLSARIILAVICWGTNDANTFGQFGFFITRDGLIPTYVNDRWLNHPPIPAYWCEAVWRLTMQFQKSDNDRLLADQLTWDTPGPWFSAVFKIPTILADCLVAWLLYRIWRTRIGERGAMAVAAGYAWCIDAILVSGYHCNTDPIYAFLILLAVYLMEDCRRFFWAGLALGAAINIKLTPVLLFPALLLGCRRWPAAIKFVLGLAIGALPFIPVLQLAGKSFYTNAIAYKSNMDRWGIEYFLLMVRSNDHRPAAKFVGIFQDEHAINIVDLKAAGADRLTGTITANGKKFPAVADVQDGQLSGTYDAGGTKIEFTASVDDDVDGSAMHMTAMRFASGGSSADLVQIYDFSWAEYYHWTGRMVLMGMIGAWSLLAWYRRRKGDGPNLYTVAAGVLGLFLFFAPGFGVQYTVMIIPVLFAAMPRMANFYGLLSGSFILLVYWAQWTGHWPPNSQFKGYFPLPSPSWGVAAWVTLGVYLLVILFRLDERSKFVRRVLHGDRPGVEQQNRDGWLDSPRAATTLAP